MTLTIDANFVWKCPNIFKAPAVEPIDAPAELAKVQSVLLRVLSGFPEAWRAVVDGLEELSPQPWPTLSEPNCAHDNESSGALSPGLPLRRRHRVLAGRTSL